MHSEGECENYVATSQGRRCHGRVAAASTSSSVLYNDPKSGYASIVAVPRLEVGVYWEEQNIAFLIGMDAGRSYVSMTYLAYTHYQREEREWDDGKKQARVTILQCLTAGERAAFVNHHPFAPSVTIRGAST